MNDSTMSATPRPILDFDRVEEATGGDHEFMRELVDLFLEDATDRIRELEAAVSAKDTEQLGKCAHKLKGSSANVGADHMSQLAKTLEDTARRAELEGARELIERLHQQLNEVGPRFERYLASQRD